MARDGGALAAGHEKRVQSEEVLGIVGREHGELGCRGVRVCPPLEPIKPVEV